MTEILSELFTSGELTENKRLSREAYLKRLATFRPTTFFAKPELISPIVCARLGWINTSIDLLACETCQASLVVTIHPKLKAAAVKKIAGIYQKRLCTSHKITCPFRCDSVPGRSDEMETVPSFFAPVLPPDMIDLVENPRPQTMMRERMRRWKECFDRSSVPHLDLSFKALQEFSEEQDEPLGARIAQACGSTDTNDDDAAILALFGWTPATSDTAIVKAECTVCLTCTQVPIRGTPNAKEGPPAKKKQKVKAMNPMLSHRHYCPMIRGFPSDHTPVPMWKIIAKNTLSKEEPESVQREGETALEAFRRLLRTGVANTSKFRETANVS